MSLPTFADLQLAAQGDCHGSALGLTRGPALVEYPSDAMIKAFVDRAAIGVPAFTVLEFAQYPRVAVVGDAFHSDALAERAANERELRTLDAEPDDAYEMERAAQKHLGSFLGIVRPIR